MIYSLSYGCRRNTCVGPITAFVGLRYIVIKSKDKSYTQHLKVLGLTQLADQEAVRKAFVTLCKKYHPDSGSPEADSAKFQEIDEAYRYLLKKFSRERWGVNEGVGEYGLYYDENKMRGQKIEEEVEEFDIKHTAPQHRQYLSWGGLGSGTPSQRQQQYSQIRAAQAAENVREHRVNKYGQEESSLTVQDRKRVHKAKTRYGMDRLVEDLIQESMARGEFENLTGAGKPLRERNFNPYVDFVTHKMNEVMIDNGFTPEWITLGREIEEDAHALRNTLYSQSKFRDDPVKWNKVILDLEDSAKALNKKIELFNLVVPILNRQMLLFNLKEETKKVLSLPPPLSEKEVDRNDSTPPSATVEIGTILATLSSLFRGN